MRRLPEYVTWGAGKRWALFVPPHKDGVIEAKPFKTQKERDAWVKANPSMRQAVGKRHPEVKRWRQAQEGRRK